MPAPACSAPPTASTAAPVYAGEPATTPTTPRRYLSASGPGTGHAAATPAAVGCSTAGGCCASDGIRPMSTSSMRPAARPAGGSSRQGLGAPNVTVTSATTCGPGVSPVSGSTPLGRSTATTTAGPGIPAGGSAATRPAAGSRSPGDAPRPTVPSTTRSAPASSAPPSSGSACRPPAASNAASPCSCTAAPSRTASTRAPLRASRAPAHSASPPLLPAPTSSTTRDPVTRPRRARSSPAHTAASPAAARCMRAPDGVRARSRSSAARTSATLHARSHPSSTSPRLPARVLTGGCFAQPRPTSGSRRSAVAEQSSRGRARRRRLLDRDRLGEVAGLVDVQALGGRELAREHLQGDHGDERRQQGRRLGDPDDLGRVRHDLVVAVLGDDDGPRATGVDLLDVRDDLAVQGVPTPRRRDDDEDRLTGLDQRDRAVLELAGREALGVDVRELLELERPLHGDGV